MTDPDAWAAGPLQTLVQELAGSPTLAPVRRVVIRPDTVRIDPPPSPAVTPAKSSVVVPTSTLRVSMVVADEGNVGAPGVAVSAEVTPLAAGTSSRATTLSR